MPKLLDTLIVYIMIGFGAFGLLSLACLPA